MRKSLIHILFTFLLFSIASAQSVSLSITNQDLALVEETRDITVNKTVSTIDLVDLPRLLDPTSVHAVFQPSSIELLEQNFIYEQANIQNILKKTVGEPIRLLHPELGTIQGTVLSFQDGTIVVQTAENELRIIPHYSTSHLVLEKSAGKFKDHFSQPKISWRLKSKSQTKAKAKISYLTGGLHWKADYTAIVGEEEENITLASLVTIINESGKSYYQADLTLIAGELHKAHARPPFPSARSGRVMEMSAKMDSPFEESKSFEYHTYHLDSKFDLQNIETKQIPLFTSTVARANKSYNYNYQRDPENVSVFFSIENSKKNNLGIPLPEGQIRIYKRDHGRLLILGEDFISNTPKDEIVKIEVGKAFDIKAERSVLEQRREGKNTEKQKIAIELRNRKDDDVIINVVEPLIRHRNARILNSNYKVHQQTADKVEFLIPIKSGQTESLNFELIYTW